MGEGEAWEGLARGAIIISGHHEQRRGGQQGGRRGLRARGGRARAATWRSSVPGEGGNNKFVNVEVCKHTELS